MNASQEIIEALEWHSVAAEQRLNAKKAFLNACHDYSWHTLNSLPEARLIKIIENIGVDNFIKWADNIISYFTNEDNFSLFVPAGWLNLFRRFSEECSEDILRKVYLFNDICRGYQIGYTEMNCLDSFIDKDNIKIVEKIKTLKATALDVLWAAYLTAKEEGR